MALAVLYEHNGHYKIQAEFSFKSFCYLTTQCALNPRS
jgi:hypothetical protein